MRDVFRNPDEHRLRAFWRIVLQAMMMVAFAVATVMLIAEPLTALHRRGLFLGRLDPDNYDRIINMIIGPLLTVAVIASVVLAVRWLDRRPIARFGVILDALWWKRLVLGLFAGAFVMSALFVSEYATGMLTITGFNVRNVATVSFALSLAFTCVKVLCVGIYEELVSRGYLLRNLAEGTNLTIAVIVSSLIFAVLHLTNEHSSVLSTAGLFVNGLLLASAALMTQRLSAAIGVHISWNLFQGAIFGFPVSGDKEGASLIGIHQLGNDLFTGGAFGPEAGLAGIVASLLGIAIFAIVYNREHDRARGRAAVYPR